MDEVTIYIYIIILKPVYGCQISMKEAPNVHKEWTAMEQIVKQHVRHFW